MLKTTISSWIKKINAKEAGPLVPLLLGYRGMPNIRPKARGRVEEAIRISTTGIVLRGWLDHPGAEVREMALVGGKGRRVITPYGRMDLPVQSVPTPMATAGRPPKADCGFLIYAPLHDISQEETHWYVEVLLDGADIVRMPFELATPSEPICGPSPGTAAALHTGGEQTATSAFGHVDEAIRILASGMLLRGWFVHTASDVREIRVASSSGRSVTAIYPPTVMRRPDVTQSLQTSTTLANDDHGFLLYVPVENLAEDEVHWNLEYCLQDGAIIRVPFELGPAQEPLSAITYILSRIELPLVDLAQTFSSTVGHCIETLWAKRQNDPVKSSVFTFGSTKTRPRVSVIIPIYGRIDFVRYQLAKFSNDPDLVGDDAIAEIIYVLDDPGLRTDFLTLCQTVYNTYGVPFKAVALNRNVGFSGANNEGARVAKGEFLLLLNSDVMPASSHWLSALVGIHGGLRDCGALGCRLLYDVGSIQHAGVEFKPSTALTGGWENVHRLKGYPVGFDDQPGPTEVPAVTAACLLVRRSVYQDVNGLTDDYIIADFEDSDFCFKLRRLGLKIWYTPAVELFHLERQSVRMTGAPDWRYVLTLYNMWKHAGRWGAAIRDQARLAHPAPPSPPMGEA